MDYVEHRMAHEAAKQPSSSALITPLNLILLSLLLYTLYKTLFSSSSSSSYPTLPRGPPPTVFRTYTPRTLLPFNGTTNTTTSSSSPGDASAPPPVYFAVRGRVFDVSRGRNFYGPGGPYANFAGRDASRGLACGSFDEDMLTEDLDGPLDDLADLGPDEMEALRGWEERFLEKYDVVGRLVSVGVYNDEQKKQQQQQQPVLSSE
ncbi:Dihydrodipicolinate synthase [Purpureocillium takamizusanense]|uniref:Dihydrodipicolinate synthase n=1 Tax=Purpureocillium takamizusanense TaxID=2060973 RepID=A0A9Q8QEE2_9HYPO|nr:Dihydrodipicolinate synthase [Purpureocillium takamizusanense]UNI19269.1 Dihydrodipicolinate synthase [Purpureocillium takamizusanense]